MSEKKIFVSYALEDKDFAKKLANVIERTGACVFSDAASPAGGVWADILRREIESADALILVIPSRNAPNRNNVWFEAGAAKALGKPVMAVLPPRAETARAELPTDIAGVLVLDADQRSWEGIAQMLMRAVETQPDAVSAS
jgi:predicted nucleotide-binding protein